MPKKWKERERKLWRDVRRRHPHWSARRMSSYVFGTLRKMGWVPSHQRGRPRTYPPGYKKCIINMLSRIKFTTPKAAHVAMRKAAQRCGKKFYRLARR